MKEKIIKYDLNKHNKNSYRIFIPMDILKEYNIKENSKIYYIIYIDETLKRHFYISLEKPIKTDNILIVDEKIIKKNAVRSLNLTFYLDNTFNLIFELFNKKYVSIVECNFNNFCFEFVFS